MWFGAPLQRIQVGGAVSGETAGGRALVRSGSSHRSEARPVKNVLLVILSLVFPLLLLEAGLRIDDATSADMAYADVELDGRRWKLPAQGRPVAGATPDVAVVGDSFVVGEKCGLEDNLTGHLGRLAAAAGGAADVLNLGIAATTPCSYYLRVKDWLATGARPRHLVVVLYSNDITVSRASCEVVEALEANVDDGLVALTADDRAKVLEMCEAAGEGARDLAAGGAAVNSGTGWKAALLHYSYALRLVREGVARMMLSAGSGGARVGRARYPSRWSDVDGLELKMIATSLARLRALLEAQSIGYTVVFYPNVEQLSAEAEMHGVVEGLKKTLATMAGVTLHNGYDAFLGRPEADIDMTWSMVDAHPNCEAHALFAQWLARLLPGAPGDG